MGMDFHCFLDFGPSRLLLSCPAALVFALPPPPTSVLCNGLSPVRRHVAPDRNSPATTCSALTTTEGGFCCLTVVPPWAFVSLWDGSGKHRGHKTDNQYTTVSGQPVRWPGHHLRREETDGKAAGIHTVGMVCQWHLSIFSLHWRSMVRLLLATAFFCVATDCPQWGIPCSRGLSLLSPSAPFPMCVFFVRCREVAARSPCMRRQPHFELLVQSDFLPNPPCLSADPASPIPCPNRSTVMCTYLVYRKL